jgi:SAM-dependent methyltransferase
MVYRSKSDWICKFISTEAEVLDLGCVCHDLSQTAVPWLHGLLCERAASVVGVDYLPEEVEKMRRQGYDAVCANVEQMDLGRKFDVVAAGDLIEHLDNFGMFLRNVRAHLKDDGVLLVTTPNPITWVRYLRVLLRGGAGANKEHTCWFTAKVLRQLAERHGLALVEEAYVDDTKLFYPWLKPLSKGSVARRLLRYAGRVANMLLIWKPAVLANSILCRIRPQLAETICMAFRASGTD